MNWYNYFLMFLTSVINVLFELLSYNKLRNKKVFINKKFIIVLLIASILITVNTYTNETLLRIIFSIMILYCSSFIIYEDSYIEVFVYTLICYVFVMLFEIVLSMIFLITNLIDLNGIDKSFMLKSAFSIINIVLVYLTVSLNFIKKICKKLINILNRNKYIIIILISILLFLFVIDFRYLTNVSSKIYINNIILLLCFTITIIFSIYNYFKSQKEVEKIDYLLNFMKKYEKMIDDDYIKRHEMLNNLLLLKSIDDKNSDDYNDILDELINTYSNNGIKIKNIYKLPSGLKGIFYYKLFGVDKDNIKVNLNISKHLSNSLFKLNNKDYKILCNIIGIILDNAVDASRKSLNKFINVDVYKENKKIIILIENSCRNKVDINKIKEKNYSTKGKGRGLGLYIANNLLRNTNNILLEQSINNKIFTTKIIIK